MRKAWPILLGLVVVVGCDGGGKGGEGGGEFRLIQFLESNQSNIERNHAITFLFSGLVRPDQDFAQRLKIQNVKQEPSSDFTLAIGDYVVSGAASRSSRSFRTSRTGATPGSARTGTTPSS